jgi:CelD/BcsL family acetyltransferase involved in cellulose biosynthesis
VLEIAGTPVAMMYAFLAADRLLVYNSGFDPTRSETSVGMVLTGMMIADAAENGVAVCDFMRGNESYKYRFGADDVPLWRVIAGVDRASVEGVAAAMTAALAVPADERNQDQ